MMETSLADLDFNVLKHIFSYVPARQRYKARATNKRIRTVIDLLYRKLFRRTLSRDLPFNTSRLFWLSLGVENDNDHRILRKLHDKIFAHLVYRERSTLDYLMCALMILPNFIHGQDKGIIILNRMMREIRIDLNTLYEHYLCYDCYFVSGYKKSDILRVVDNERTIYILCKIYTMADEKIIYHLAIEDDSKELKKVGSAIYNERGYKITEAESIRECARLLNKERAALAFFDVSPMLPDSFPMY